MRAITDRCGARRRNGEPCRKLPMRNGRCRLHGGRTPAGTGLRIKPKKAVAGVHARDGEHVAYDDAAPKGA
ncbi:HGGxSTG domain-containing protein [Sphingobium sp. R-7]|uniref:HGGxSTG domain-containing protein n=1 Tax=Sphingobium sp. R-7 TaxID=3375449 RepID=UPI00398A5229